MTKAALAPCALVALVHRRPACTTKGSRAAGDARRASLADSAEQVHVQRPRAADGARRAARRDVRRHGVRLRRELRASSCARCARRSTRHRHEGRRDERATADATAPAPAAARGLRQRRHRDERRTPADLAAASSTCRGSTRCRATRASRSCEPGRRFRGIGFKSDPQLTRFTILRVPAAREASCFRVTRMMFAPSRSLHAVGLALRRAAQGAPRRGPLPVRVRQATPSTHAQQRSSCRASSTTTYIGGGIVARCPQQKIVLKSDSLEVYGDEGRFYFIGHVDYAEPRLKLKSDYPHVLPEGRAPARVVQRRRDAAERLEAQGPLARVLPRDAAHPCAAVRASPIGRPTINIIEKDPQGKAQPPVTVTGNTVWMLGDSVVSSRGRGGRGASRAHRHRRLALPRWRQGTPPRHAQAEDHRHQGASVHARRRDDRPAVEAQEARPRARVEGRGSGRARTSTSSRTRSTCASPTTCCSAPWRGERVARARRRPRRRWSPTPSTS